MQQDQSFHIGIDVGSTTVKLVLVSGDMDIRWSAYQRHEGQQALKLLGLLQQLEDDFPALTLDQVPAYITGSGGTPLAKPLGARFIQEVNAVTLAVEYLHPDVRSVVELGGQDAKIIHFKGAAGSPERQVITSMNDKCASGTGATLDKCMMKVGISPSDVANIPHLPDKIHPVAAKCGVFAETDVVNLIKSGVPAEEILNSLADAIVMQNLSVLTRGNILQPNVLLLGGPNTYLPFLQKCWRTRIVEVWHEHQLVLPDGPLERLIHVPENAQYYAAYGAVVFGVGETGETGETRYYAGAEALQEYLQNGASKLNRSRLQQGLWQSQAELSQFLDEYRRLHFQPRPLKLGESVNAYVGIDGGSTSSKAVLMDEQGVLISKAYLLSKGNPIEDSKALLMELNQHITRQGATLNIKGCGVTGYAGDVLQKALSTDANVVETIAHLRSAQHYCGDDIDVICDIGGQDIKVLFMKNGEIDHFKLSNQCSAGNGMLLQAMAQQFGVPLEKFAEVAFSAESAPEFSYGCAVFLDSDRVNFQKEGYRREELFAGLCQVLPKNIWQYVVQVPRLAAFGRKFVLQGGTQHNLAAVKAQVDYIKQRVPDAEVKVHPHTGECGAIGAALEAIKQVKEKGYSDFIGIQNSLQLSFSAQTSEETRCRFCDNLCSRTFIDIEVPQQPQPVRHITGFACEKGQVESKEQVVSLAKLRRKLKSDYPNLVDYESRLLFSRFYQVTQPPIIRPQWWQRLKKPPKSAKVVDRDQLRIGIPRVLNIYTIAPFMRGYLEALGIKPQQIQFSDQSSERLWDEGSRYGSIDPCFPAKVSLAHIHNLLNKHHQRKPLHLIWFPAITQLPQQSPHSRGSSSCPVVAGTPSVANAAFTKARDLFADAGVSYLSDVIDMQNERLLKQQLFDTFVEPLALARHESDWAVAQGLAAMQHCDAELQKRAEKVLHRVKRDHQVVLLLLARPYHSDPGLNHELLEAFQALGYPILSIRSLPRSSAFLQRYFGDDIASGRIKDVLDINDVWPENYASNSAQKVWAAKFAARHNNIAVIDLSSFKCGHDAPSYGLIERIINNSNTPYFALHDIDANKPSGSINIRIRTFAHTLENYCRQLEQQAAQEAKLTKRVFHKRQQLATPAPSDLAHDHFNEDLESEKNRLIARAALQPEEQKTPLNNREREHGKQ
ncbi:MAG: acyl-CoA dehydratase activase-related protein [Gammaproteobacteria bacterium]|nr:acyl-CoA dehydratase activase-related protein [Gammaproteobacteria bacterium]